MTWKARGIVAGVAALALAGSFVAGRLSRPAEVREVVKTEWRVHVTWFWQQTTKVVMRHRTNVVRVEVARPDGTTITTETDRSETDTDTVASSSAGGETQQEEKTVSERTTKDQPRYSLGVQATAPFSDLRQVRPEVTGGIRVAGPFWLRAGVVVDRDPRVSFGGSFDW